MKKAIVVAFALFCCGNSDTSKQTLSRQRPAQAVAEVAKQKATQADSIYHVVKTKLTQMRILANPHSGVRILSIKRDREWMQKLHLVVLQPLNLSTVGDLINRAQEYLDGLKKNVEETMQEAENAEISALADNAEHAEIYTRRAMEANRKAQKKAKTTLGLVLTIERVIDNIDISKY